LEVLETAKDILLDGEVFWRMVVDVIEYLINDVIRHIK